MQEGWYISEEESRDITSKCNSCYTTLPEGIVSLLVWEDGEKSFSPLYEKIQRTHFHMPPFFMVTQFDPIGSQDFSENTFMEAQEHAASRKGRTSFFTLV